MKPATPHTSPDDGNPRDPDPDRSPPLPATEVHSGTGTSGAPVARTPDDAHGPESPASPVRNPVPLPDPADPRPAPHAAAAADDDSPTGEGYWQHDESGPAAYVPPLVKGPDSDDSHDLRHLAEALSLQLGTLPDWEAQSVHLRRVDGRLELFGIVTSEVIRRAAQRCVEQESGETVENTLVLR
jgi:hypothetical protein